MTLQALITSIKEDKLDKFQMEHYHTELTYLYTDFCTRMAELEKKEALYLNTSEEKTRAGAERKWYALPEGQEMITLKHNLRATEKLLSSLKHRIYNTL